MQKPFINDMQTFLKKRIDNANFSEISTSYRKTANEINELIGLLKPLLSAEDQKILRNLDDEHSNRLTIALEIAYQQGFAEGLKFLLYLLTIL